VDHPAQQYYNPDLTPAQERALLRRNYLLIEAVQAALGLIGPDLLGIAVEDDAEAIILHFAVARRTAEIEEDIEEIFSEFGAFLTGGPEGQTPIRQTIHVGRPDRTWSGRDHVLAYIAKRGWEAESDGS
jgi:hypothetical protein